MTRRLADMSLGQQAAILGSGAAFWRFLNETRGYAVESADDAAEALRELCGVTSRRDIKPGTAAAAAFLALKGEFDLWMRCLA